MKHLIFKILIFLLFIQQINAQTNDMISSWRSAQLNKIVNLIKNDNVSQLSNLFHYPIKRPNPIPNIENKEAFILYYPILFDSAFKQKLINAKFTAENTIDKQDTFGLFCGDIWVNKIGEIIAMNYSSPAEASLQKILTKEAQSLMHSSVMKWKTNMLVCKSDKFLIRVDLLDDNILRYVSWNSPKNVSDKPDLILLNGIKDFQGSMGGITYTFKSSNWTYIIDRVDLCEDEEDCGLSLKLFLNGEQKVKTRLKEIK